MAVTALKGIQLAEASIEIDDLTATGTPGSTTYLRGDNTWTNPVADIPISLLAPTVTETIPAGYSAVVVGSYEIPSGFILDIGNASVFSID